MEARTTASLLLLCLFIASICMVEGAYRGRRRVPRTPTLSPNAPRVYIIFTSKSGTSFYLQILSAVLGSKKAAEDALIYSYNDIGGFSASLTPKQAAQVLKQPGVLSMIPPKRSQLVRPAGLKDHIKAGSEQ